MLWAYLKRANRTELKLYVPGTPMIVSFMYTNDRQRKSCVSDLTGHEGSSVVAIAVSISMTSCSVPATHLLQGTRVAQL